MNNTELCRNNLHNRLGIFDKDSRSDLKVLGEIRSTILKLEEVLSLCKPRLIMGGIRYGSNWKYPDLTNYIKHKLNKYIETGNYEMIIDVINLCIVEGNIKTHSNFHFKSEDR